MAGSYKGEKLVVITSAEYDYLIATADEQADLRAYDMAKSALAAGEDATLASSEGTLNLGSEKQLSLFTNDQLAMKGKSIASEAKENHDVTVGQDMKVKVTNDYHNKAGGNSFRTTTGHANIKVTGNLLADASQQRHQEGASQSAQDAEKPTAPKTTASTNPTQTASGDSSSVSSLA